MTAFKVGDVVKLKSGGPPMTVIVLSETSDSTIPEGAVRCQWFAGNALKSENFLTATLITAPIVTVGNPKSLEEILLRARKRSGLDDEPSE